MIQVQNLHIAYPDGSRAIQDLSFKVESGASVALVGANGAGKSTLLGALVGIIQITSGTIWVDGLEVYKTNLPTIRAQTGMVFQNPDDQLFMPSIYDDLAFGPRNAGLGEAEVSQRVAEVMTDLNIDHLRDKMPHKLSGGEKRVAALGSVLAMRPSTLLLDEPSSFLDPRARRHLISLLARLAQTKLIATHDLEMARALCERVIVLKKGSLFADGPTSTILSDADLLEAAGL